MNVKRNAIVLSLLLALAGPAAAGWQGWDMTPEPNTAYDAESGLMWTDPVGDSTDQKIYLDAYMMADYGLVSPAWTTNNVPGGRFMPVTGYATYALLGFWVDCNDDGYIGNALTGTITYSSFLLADAEKCPAGSVYNTGDEVDEWRAIYRGGPFEEGDDPRDPYGYDLIEEGDGLYPWDWTVDPNDVFDPAAKIWGDWSTPDKDAVPSQGLMPLPPGTLTSWYGHFKYVDDATLGDLSATVDGAAGEDTYYAIPRTLPDAYLGENEDPLKEDGNSDSPVAYARYGYNDSTTETGGEQDCGGYEQPDCEGAYAQPHVMAFDCDDSENGIYAPTVDPETGETDDGMYLGAPIRPGPVNPDGSLDGTLRQNTRAVLTAEEGTCDRGGVGIPLYGGNLEAPSQQSSVKGEKTQPDFHFLPVYEWRFRFGGVATDAGLPERVSTPESAFCKYVDDVCFGRVNAGGYWYDTHGWSRRPPRAYWGLTETIDVTYYADVTPGGLDDAGASQHAFPGLQDNAASYGSEACTEASSTGTSSNGWNCDPAAWNTGDETPFMATIGDPYDLRDQDCYDGSYEGVAVMPVDRPCETA